ncbi:hypothetical protein KCP75_05110 [Salmonella enterica subsp. enterica]|nr:hypothetical protein KCP75_05110 [Salmonella enterica subsp. enterica]
MRIETDNAELDENAAPQSLREKLLSQEGSEDGRAVKASGGADGDADCGLEGELRRNAVSEESGSGWRDALTPEQRTWRGNWSRSKRHPKGKSILPPRPAWTAAGADYPG